MGADDEHFGVLIGHVDDAGVVELVVGLKHRDQDGVFAMLLVPVFVELLEEVFVGFLGGRSVGLVLHLEHDGDDLGLLRLVFVIAEDEIALGARFGRDLVVLAEFAIGVSWQADAVEFVVAMLLQTLPNEFSGHLCLEVFVVIDLVLFGLDKRVVLIAGFLLFQLIGAFVEIDFALQLRDPRLFLV